MSIRIRVNKTPIPQSASTGDQINRSLYTGPAKPQASDPEEEQGLRTQLRAVPEAEANIEAERGETVLGDFDQDGQLEHFTIGGQRHSRGGTKLSVPDGSFVFSNTRKLAIKGDILEAFGKKDTSVKYTPAQLAKQYDLNKYKAILEDPGSDKLDRDTASLMLENNQKKLAKLAIVQEGVKGFPNGIPEFAQVTLGLGMPQEEGGQQVLQHGGLVKAQLGLEKAKRLGRKVDHYAGEGYQKLGDVAYDTYERTYYGMETPGTASVGTGKYHRQPTVPWIRQFAEKGVPYQELVRRKAIRDTPEHKKIFDQYYKPIAGAEDYVYTERQFALPGDPVQSTPTIQTTASNTLRSPADLGQNPHAADASFVGNQPDIGMPWWTQDVMNTGMALYNRMGLRKYMPAYFGLNPYLPNPTFHDPARQLAAGQEGAMQANMMSAMYAGPQRLRAMGTSVQGQGLTGAANTLAQYSGMNVAPANEFEVRRKDILNNAAAANVGARKQYFDEVTTANQQWDNSVRTANTMVNAHAVNGLTNAQKAYWTNRMNPRYNIDPRSGRIHFMGGLNPLTDSLPGGSYGGYGSGSGLNIDAYRAAYNSFIQQFPGQTKEAHEWASKQVTGTRSRLSANSDGDAQYMMSGYGMSPAMMAAYGVPSYPFGGY